MSRKILMMSKNKRAALKKQLDDLQRRHLKELEELNRPLFGGRHFVTASKTLQQKYRAEDSSKYPSLYTNEDKTSATAKKSSPVYTGELLMGIATMHKSNMVPIFSEKEAVEVATMRRN